MINMQPETTLARLALRAQARRNEKECFLLRIKLQYPMVQWHLPQLQPGKHFALLR